MEGNMFLFQVDLIFFFRGLEETRAKRGHVLVKSHCFNGFLKEWF